MKQFLISSLLLCALTASAQNSADTTLNRNVTVERDFQPQLNTFDETDRRYLEELVSVLSKTLYEND